MRIVNRIKGTLALTAVVLLCSFLFLLLSVGPVKAAPGQTVLVSTSSSGVQGNNDCCDIPSISSDGRYVAFESYASNLVEGDTNGYRDIFRKDLATGETVLVSTSSSKVQGNSYSRGPSISSDGRYVAFYSHASNLVGGDANGNWDIFRKDLTTGETVLVSTSASEVQGNGDSLYSSISPDGRYVAFESYASNLVEGDTNGYRDIFRKDLTTGQVVLVSTSSPGVQGNSYSRGPSISSDGSYVAFYSYASNLVEGDANGNWDIFRKDLATGETVLVSASSPGVQGNSYSRGPSISPDGRYVAFESYASNLVGGDKNGSWDIFRKDLATGQTVLVSTSSSGAQGDYSSSNPSMTPDGRYVAFYSFATGLAGWDMNGNNDVFRKDLSTGQTLLVSPSSSGGLGDGGSLYSTISSNGRYVAFVSSSTNLTEGDTNGYGDVFRRDLLTVNSITPVSGATNTIVNITNLAGMGFEKGATVRIERTGTTVNATDVNVVSDTQITCKLNLTGAPTGMYDVIVINPSAQEAKLTQGFSVATTMTCGGGAAISVSIFGVALGLMSLAGSTGLRRRLKRK